jgi:hypothetical protein
MRAGWADMAAPLPPRPFPLLDFTYFFPFLFFYFLLFKKKTLMTGYRKINTAGVT